MFFIPDKMLYKYNVNKFQIPNGKVYLICILPSTMIPITHYLLNTFLPL